MSYIISFVSLLGLILCLPFNFFLLSYLIVSFSLLWLVMGAILVSVVSSLKKFTGLWFLFMIILFYSFSASNLLIFYIMFEFSLIPILLMIVYWGNHPERLSAGLYFLIYTSMLSIPFLIIIIFLLKMMSFSVISINTSSFLLILMSLAPFLVKMPVFGLHFWLPKAHVEASTSGSMILAGVLLKLGSYGIFRLVVLLNIFLFKLTSFWLFLAMLASLLTFMQSDVKKLVAYSSVTHMTFLMLGLSSFYKNLVLILILVSLSHGWASMGMFMYAGNLSHTSNSRLGLLMMTENKFNWGILALGVLLVSNASLPPFPSFFPELFMLSSMSLLSNFIVFFLILSLSVCYYNTYLYMLVSHKKGLEKKMGSFSSSEFLKVTFLICWTIISLEWLFVLS